MTAMTSRNHQWLETRSSQPVRSEMMPAIMGWAQTTERRAGGAAPHPFPRPRRPGGAAEQTGEMGVVAGDHGGGADSRAASRRRSARALSSASAAVAPVTV